MGKVGYLPDISGTFVHWRGEYIKGRQFGDWGMASLGLHNMNGALEQDYRLPIDTELWNEKEGGYIVWSCKSCTTKIKHVYNEGKEDEREAWEDEPTISKRKDIMVFWEKCSESVRILTGKDQRQMWICPKCDKRQSVTDVQKKMMKYPEPHFRGCIYSEPDRPLTGLMRRRGTYPLLMRRWTTSYSLELEHKLALYRLEYIRINGHDMDGMEGTGYDEKGGD